MAEQSSMEVDVSGKAVEEPQNPSGSQTIMAGVGTAGSVTVSLHPLVIMNISEHWTRTKAQAGAPQKVYGALIGKQKGRNIEVMNSFELDFNTVEGKVIIDRDYYNVCDYLFISVFFEKYKGFQIASYTSGYNLLINIRLFCKKKFFEIFQNGGHI